MRLKKNKIKAIKKYKKIKDRRNKEEKELEIDINVEVEIVNYINSKITDLSVENKEDPFQIEMISNLINYLRKFKSNNKDKTLISDLLQSFYLLKNEVTRERIDELLKKIPVYKNKKNETKKKTYEKSHAIDISKHLN